MQQLSKILSKCPLLNLLLELLALLFILVMFGDNLNPQTNNNPLSLFNDWLNPSAGRQSHSYSRAFDQQYHNAENTKSFGTGMIEKIINFSDVKVEEDFKR